MNAILQVENLTKQYADFKLDHVSFSVPKGTIMGLIGENGAGKSTTINAILDFIFIKLGFGITGVAISTVLAEIIKMMEQLLFGGRNYRPQNKSKRMLA